MTTELVGDDLIRRQVGFDLLAEACELSAHFEDAVAAESRAKAWAARMHGWLLTSTLSRRRHAQASAAWDRFRAHLQRMADLGFGGAADLLLDSVMRRTFGEPGGGGT